MHGDVRSSRPAKTVQSTASSPVQTRDSHNPVAMRDSPRIPLGPCHGGSVSSSPAPVFSFVQNFPRFHAADCQSHVPRGSPPSGGRLVGWRYSRRTAPDSSICDGRGGPAAIRHNSRTPSIPVLHQAFSPKESGGCSILTLFAPL